MNPKKGTILLSCTSPLPPFVKPSLAVLISGILPQSIATKPSKNSLLLGSVAIDTRHCQHCKSLIELGFETVLYPLVIENDKQYTYWIVISKIMNTSKLT